MLRKGVLFLLVNLFIGMAECKLSFPVAQCLSLPRNVANIDKAKYRAAADCTLDTPIVDVLAISRGGSLTIDKTDESIIVKKLRNIIRSVLRLSEKKAPILGKVLKIFWGTVEQLTGIELLPKKAKSSKKEKKKIKVDEKKTPKQDDKKKRNAGSGATQQHLSKDLKSTNPNYRIQRELKEFLRAPPPNLKVKVGKNIRIWIITMKGAKNTLYENEVYRLRVQFPPDYPTVPPSVYFLQPTPRHEHVYTNGDICLSLLGKDWRPTMTAQSIAVSILSILSGAQRKSLPMDNAAHAQNKPGEKQDNWVYHDDNC